MNVDLVLGIVSTVVVLMFGLLVMLGLGDRFISGYNTASEEKKARYNLRRLRMSTCSNHDLQYQKLEFYDRFVQEHQLCCPPLLLVLKRKG